MIRNFNMATVVFDTPRESGNIVESGLVHKNR